jgi:oxygen-independent coproporphyrinogen-3 oxidase
LTELTLEANPISLTYEKAREYLGLGVNRLSIGVQSFDPVMLRAIGRPHRPKEAVRTYEDARRAGFENISFDLMYGLPGQMLDALEDDLNRVVELRPDHVSCFALETIPLTPFGLKRQLGLLDAPMPPNDARMTMHRLVFSRLADAGYRHYGALNFALPGKESEHNRIAFRAPQGEYIGWGNSAYSFMNDCVYTNLADTSQYVEALEERKSPVSYLRKATLLELASRFLVLGLKFLHVSHRDFEYRFGAGIAHFFSPQLLKLTEHGLLVVDDRGVTLTDLGAIYVNNVCKEFYVGQNIGRSQYVQPYFSIDAKEMNRLFDQAERRNWPGGAP